MEPIRTTKTARLRALKMYRDDLDEVVALFQRSCSAVTISDGRNRYESLDEMKTHVGSRVKNLDVRGEKPGLHFLLNQKEWVQGASAPTIFNELRTEEIADEADALFYEVKDALVAHQRPRVRVPFAVCAMVALVATVFFVAQVHGPQDPLPWRLLVCALLFAGLTVAAVKIDNYLSLETRVNSLSFWARNREAFAAHAITTAIGALVGGIIGWLIGHYLK